MKRLINYMIIFGGKEPHPFGCWWRWAKGPKWQDHKDHSATG
jgi:hypothetical protein